MDKRNIGEVTTSYEKNITMKTPKSIYTGVSSFMLPFCIDLTFIEVTETSSSGTKVEWSSSTSGVNLHSNCVMSNALGDNNTGEYTLDPFDVDNLIDENCNEFSEMLSEVAVLSENTSRSKSFNSMREALGL